MQNRVRDFCNVVFIFQDFYNISNLQLQASILFSDHVLVHMDEQRPENYNGRENPVEVVQCVRSAFDPTNFVAGYRFHTPTELQEYPQLQNQQT